MKINTIVTVSAVAVVRTYENQIISDCYSTVKIINKQTKQTKHENAVLCKEWSFIFLNYYISFWVYETFTFKFGVLLFLFVPNSKFTNGRNWFVSVSNVRKFLYFMSYFEKMPSYSCSILTLASNPNQKKK